MKHKVAGISLLLCLVGPIATTLLLLHYQKSLIRKEVKHCLIAGVDKNDLVLLKFTKEESCTKLRWEHSGEFEYNRQMYDIVEKQVSGDTVLYWCWHDREETELNQQLDELFARVLGENPIRKDKQEKVLEFFKKLYTNSFAKLLPVNPEHITPYFIHAVNYPGLSQTPPDPPPRSG